VARLAFGWELGGEFGHAMSCAGLARSMALRGHAISFIFRELRQLALLPETAGYDLFRAPVLAKEGLGMAAPSSLAEIMLGCGYADAEWLTAALREWLRLLGEWKPDLLVADYAPTALLAARVMGLKRVSLSISFAVPPPLSPLPPFRFDRPPPPERVAAADAQVLATVNRALSAVGAAPLGALHEQFQSDEDFILTFPELDAYGNRPTARYWGPRYRDDAGISVHWPAGRGPRVLVYLKRELPQMDALIDLLAASPCRVIAYIPDLELERARRLKGALRIVSDKPVRFSPLLSECDLFVSQAGSAATGTVLAGVPQLMFPVHYEQYLSAIRIAQLGAGIALLPAATAAEVAKAWNLMMTQRGYRDGARAYAKRYPAYSPAEQQKRIVQRIEDILRTPRQAGAAPA
jgi:UDP:flavonoid glycosyltransferase YjiC (YdhE family)